MTERKFDIRAADTQATIVEPIAPEAFDYKAWGDYETELLERCGKYVEAEEGILVYRRMRVAEVFSYGCSDMKTSLEYQLGALKKSMEYRADVPNFLEPWYGIGVAASAYGAEYVWHDGQAPAVKALFNTVEDALRHEPVQIKDTPIGKHILKMTEYFVDKTRGKLPVSLCDVQSPLNAASNIVDINNFMMDILMTPDKVGEFLDIVADLIIDFAREQMKIIGDCLAMPGHGFASARNLSGFGMSDDNVVMISGEVYEDVVKSSFEKCGEAFGGGVFHSCGDWSSRIPAIMKIKGLRTVDGAFSAETDPTANPPEPFAKAFAGSGIVVNARIVGSPDTVVQKLNALYRPGMKLIAVTYSQSPEEQNEAYERIEKVFRKRT